MTRTYGRLWREAGGWTLVTDEAHVVIRLKQLFSRIAKHSPGPFRFPDDAFHCAELEWFTHRYPLAMSATDRDAIDNGKRLFEKTLADLERILQPDWTAPDAIGLRDGQRGRHYQMQAVELLKRNLHLLLGDDIGLGKTYTALLAATFPALLPMAIVVEPHLQKQWAEKTSEFTLMETHAVTKTKAYELPPAPITLFRYSNIFGWTTLFQSGYFKTVVYDEIQNLRTGGDTEKGKAAKILSSHTEYQLGMSATPIYNLGAEIHTIYGFLSGRGGENPLGNKHEFLREWTNDGKSLKNPDALGSHLRERHLLLRRTKGDVGQQIDSVTVIPQEIEYDQKEEKRVEDLATTLAIKSLSGSFLERGSAVRDLDILLRQVTGVAKAKSVAQFCQMLMEDGEPILLAGWHREFYAIVDRYLTALGKPKFRPLYYTGTESPAQKEKSKAAFLGGESMLLMMSLRSGSGCDGIQNICSTAVVGELDWSPMVHTQFIGRLDREGQKKPVMAFMLHANGGSDPAIIERLGIKKHQIRGVMDPNAIFTSNVDDGSRLQSLARDFLNRRGIAIPVGEE